MNIEFKITSWERVIIPEELEEIVLERIKSGDITSSAELLEEFGDCTFDGVIDEVTEQMSVKQNNGYSTIEVKGDEYEDIWKNGADN